MRSGPAGESEGAGAERCPICGKPASAASRPFCSVRCADLDLGQWLTGGYAVPVEPDEEEREEIGRLAGHE